jgi:hypothetical protein
MALLTSFRPYAVLNTVLVFLWISEREGGRASQEYPSFASAPCLLRADYTSNELSFPSAENPQKSKHLTQGVCCNRYAARVRRLRVRDRYLPY